MKNHFLHILSIVFILGFISHANIGNCQQTEIDSLKKELTKSSGKDKINTLLSIAEIISEQDLNASLKYSYEALQLAEELGNDKIISNCYKSLGGYYLAIGKLDESLKYFTLTLQYNSYKNDNENLCFIYNDLGVIYSRKGQLDSALFYHQAAYSWSVEKKDSLNIIASLRDIGNAYYKKGDFDKALSHFRQGLSLSEITLNGREEESHLLNNMGILYSDWGELDKALNYYTDALNIMDSLENHFDMGRIYNNMGNIYWYKESYDSALYYYNLSLKKREKLGDLNGKAYVLNNLGMIYGSMGSFDQSLDYFKQSLHLFEKVDNKGGVVMVTYNTAYVYLATENYENAKKYLNQGLLIAQEQGYKDYIQTNLDALKDVYMETEDWENAYFILEKYKAVNDSIKNQQNMDIIKELEIKYENEKYKADLSILKNQNEAAKAKRNRYLIVIIGLIIVIGLIILSTYLLIIRMRSSTSNEYNKLAPTLLRYQMNPEFINSSLTGIKELISKNRVKESGLFLSGFAKLMRIFIETSSNQIIILDKELETIKQFIHLHQLRYEHEIDFDFKLDEKIESEMLAIPPLLLFPAFVHIIDYHLHIGKINIQMEIQLQGNQLIFKLLFDYFLDKHHKKNDKHDLKKSITSIQDRIKSINKSYKEQIEFKQKLTQVDDKSQLLLHVVFPVKPI
jgi:tetratricopeptide (TPR) repeat protein